MVGRPLCALVVEDEPRNRNLLKDLLTLKGALVVGEATNAETAWKQIVNLSALGGLDVVFMDIALDYPTTGINLACALRDLPVSPRLVFMTGVPGMEAVIEAGYYDYFLRKPLIEEELDTALDLVRQALSKSAATDIAMDGSGLARPSKPAPLVFKHQAVDGWWGQCTHYEVIHVDRIVYCRTGSIRFEDGDGKYKTLTGKIRAVHGYTEKLSDWEQLLAPRGFMLINKGLLVNLARVVCLKQKTGKAQSYKLTLRGADKDLPVAEAYWRGLSDALGNSEPWS